MTQPTYVLYFRGNGGSGRRIGFSASKKLGNAVCRNRMKRRFRHAVAEVVERFPQGYDYIFVIRTAALALDAPGLREAIARGLARVQEKAVKHQRCDNR